MALLEEEDRYMCVCQWLDVMERKIVFQWSIGSLPRIEIRTPLHDNVQFLPSNEDTFSGSKGIYITRVHF